MRPEWIPSNRDAQNAGSPRKNFQEPHLSTPPILLPPPFSVRLVRVQQSQLARLEAEVAEKQRELKDSMLRIKLMTAPVRQVTMLALKLRV